MVFEEMTQSIVMVLVHYRIISWTETATVPHPAHHFDSLQEYLEPLPILNAKLPTLSVRQAPFKCFSSDTILEDIVT